MFIRQMLFPEIGTDFHLLIEGKPEGRKGNTTSDRDAERVLVSRRQNIFIRLVNPIIPVGLPERLQPKRIGHDWIVFTTYKTFPCRWIGNLCPERTPGGHQKREKNAATEIRNRLSHSYSILELLLFPTKVRK